MKILDKGVTSPPSGSHPTPPATTDRFSPLTTVSRLRPIRRECALIAALLAMPATAGAQDSPRPTGYASPTAANRPVVPRRADPTVASFVDPTVRIDAPQRVGLAPRTFVAPFAELRAGHGTILIGAGSDVQDSVTIDATEGDVAIGDGVPVAHGSTILGPAQIGAAGGPPSFMSFNSEVEGAIIEPDCYVSGLAKVGPGVVLHSGTKVKPGLFVRTQQEADDPSLGKVTAITPDDRTFEQGVLSVNQNLARGYTSIFNVAPWAVRGVGPDPDDPDFNPGSVLPLIGGLQRPYPTFRDRIIGRVEIDMPPLQLAAVMGDADSVRADEGFPIIIRSFARVEDHVTFHSLEFTGIAAGRNGRYGYHCVVHGAPNPLNDPPQTTRLGDNVTVGEYAVVYRSTLGDDVVVGDKAYVDGCEVAPGTHIPPRTILINNAVVGTVEW